MPGIGHRREDLTDYPVLFWTVGAYLIFYRAARQESINPTQHCIEKNQLVEVAVLTLALNA
jgi:4-amino-4-deoxy-L-arabinose transferase-like glycosyltransferase